MKSFLTVLIFVLGGFVAFSLLGAGVVFLASAGELPDTAAGHYIMSVVYFMMSCSLVFSVFGMISGIVGSVLGFLLASRSRTLISLALGIISGVIWHYLLTCRL